MWFEEHYDAIAPIFLLDAAYECNGGPTLTCTDPNHPRSAPWKAEWAVVFSDGKYFRVKECFKRLPAPHKGYGEREHFSFHYGNRHPEDDARGFPKTAPRDQPPDADLRIDIDSRLVEHIHVGTKEHISQRRVKGLTIRDANLFTFLEAVLEHRQTGTPLVDLLQIQVVD